jgi:hypothetical protein
MLQIITLLLIKWNLYQPCYLHTKSWSKIVSENTLHITNIITVFSTEIIIHYQAVRRQIMYHNQHCVCSNMTYSCYMGAFVLLHKNVYKYLIYQAKCTSYRVTSTYLCYKLSLWNLQDIHSYHVPHQKLHHSYNSLLKMLMGNWTIMEMHEIGNMTALVYNNNHIRIRSLHTMLLHFVFHIFVSFWKCT